MNPNNLTPNHNEVDSDDEDYNNAPYAARPTAALPPPGQLFGGNYETSLTGSMFRSMAQVPPASYSLFGVGAVETSGSSSDGVKLYQSSTYQKEQLKQVAPSNYNPQEFIESINSLKPWVWEIPSLLPVPMYHPIDRNALYLEGLSLDTVAARISNFFHGNSVTCSYHAEEPGRTDCLTQGLLKFAVQLWQGKDNKIIMEVQRRQGCSIEMQNLRCRLYRAVQHGEEETGKTETTADPASYDAQRTVSDRMATSMEGFLEMEKIEAEDTFPPPLEISNELLSSKLLDQQRLGLESLCIMTDPCKFFSKESDRISRVVLSGDENGDTKLRDNLEKYFIGVELQGDGATTARMSDDDDLLRYSQGQFHGANHLLALRVLSNALESVSWQKQHQPDQPLALDPTSMFWRPVVKALVYNLTVAAQRPIEAALSVKCIRLLQGLEPEAMAETTAHLLPHLENAYRFGRAHHLWLQQESEQLLGRLAVAH